MCAVFRRDRHSGPLVTPATPDSVEATWVSEEGDWSAQAPCVDCAGYKMLLEAPGPVGGDLAATSAGAFLARINALGVCMGSEVRNWRTIPMAAGSEAQVRSDSE